MGKKMPVVKPLLWLLTGVTLILVPIIATLIILYVSNLMYLTILLMYGLFSLGFLMIFKSYYKLAKNPLMLISVLAELLIPLIFAYFVVVPLVLSATALLYVLLHVVFSGGVLTLYSQRGKISKLF
jgi:hypothetical protein